MVILIGPSGCGKTTIERKLEEKGLFRIISYTTRKKRAGEVNGVTYHYISKEKFERLDKEGFFLEKTFYNENYYGAAKEDFKENAVGVFEVEGLEMIKDKDIEFTSFYINVPRHKREDRMKKRGDNLDDVKKRLKSDDEIFKVEKINPDFIIDNDNLENTVNFIYEIQKTL